MILKRSVRQKALPALMAHVTAAVPPVVPHVLVQLVFISEGFPALGTFKGSKGLTDEQMLESGILGKRREKTWRNGHF